MNRGYQLLDFGHGRKLEQFGERLVDRPCPAANEVVPCLPARKWQAADLSFDRQPRQGWVERQAGSSDWQIELADLEFQLRPTPFGHLGIFPEQESNWYWLRNLVRGDSSSAMRCLNLFAYTGASTLALAQAGGAVVHVDASRPTLEWARENARRNRLAAAPIRWLHEDARKFVQRELRRGNRYEVILLDPPSYGHGPQGQSWNFCQDMAELLANVFALLSDRAVGVLWTGHNEVREMRPFVTQAATAAQACGLREFSEDRATLVDGARRPLDCGYLLRWSRWL
jgi:23S rRNA (cytosine1962-C5)-methyltransferase